MIELQEKLNESRANYLQVKFLEELIGCIQDLRSQIQQASNLKKGQVSETKLGKQVQEPVRGDDVE